MASTYTPSHTDFVVEFKSGDFASSLITRRDFAPGEILAFLTEGRRSARTYQTDNIDLNSDFAYSNHSCVPNAVFDLSSTDPAKWNVRALTNIPAGTPVVWFYPSTEWEMIQPFECQCGTEQKKCVGRIQGAKALTYAEVAGRGWISPWIEELMMEREKRR
ncbi:hypothetical protein MSAN_00462800 [Mycena sanguinolenta]|uniref:SET domain-containing protein n=1 Tax=Mycena sanguinolenta TaxID=230812 RepID=A0A8H7DKJ4_9AGAR|nr:hypothetical protein MSAN_00462800 [Mycena sanguinolenta]